MKEALISDSFAAMFGALIGTSTTTSYIESAAGVSAGGRTGLTAAFVGLFFLLALFFAPLAGMIPAYASAAALLYVACVMARGLAEIDWEDVTEYAPAVVTAITMPLTYSIATGIGLGFITYTLAKLIGGKIRDAAPAIVVLAILFAVKFAVVGRTYCHPGKPGRFCQRCSPRLRQFLPRSVLKTSMLISRPSFAQLLFW
jgi:adenine/guanine/hypoxanthine permease